MSVPLREIARVETGAETHFRRERGLLTVFQATAEGHSRELRFDNIPGGEARAQEIARTISRQRDYLQRDDASAPEGRESTAIVDAEVEADVEPVLEVVVGRGVASYVEDHGGRLFVWGEPFGAFEWLKASTRRPGESLSFDSAG